LKDGSFDSSNVPNPFMISNQALDMKLYLIHRFHTSNILQYYLVSNNLF